MLLRIIPLAAFLITLIAMMSTIFWTPSWQDGLFGPTHGATVSF